MYQILLKGTESFFEISSISFQKALELALRPSEVYQRQQEYQQKIGYAYSTEQIGLFSFEEISMSIVYFLQYMAMTKSVKKHTSRHKVVNNKNASKAKRKQPLRFKTIETTRYEYTRPEHLGDESEYITEELKRHFNYVLSKWSVRGHWRTYKNGQRVWISPQTRKRKGLDVDKTEGKNFVTEFKKED